MKRASKFGNVKTVVDGIEFSSKKEARRYGELQLLQRAGAISGLRVQPRYPLRVGEDLVCTYVADFAYHDLSVVEGDLFETVEDVKSEITRKHPVYRIKNKLFKAVMGFEITEV